MQVTAGPLQNIVEVDAWLPSGGKPGRIAVSCAKGETNWDLPNIGETMNVEIVSDSGTVTLSNCRVIGLKPKTGNRAISTVILEDERWKWLYEFVNGTFNFGFDGFGLKTTEKTATDLWNELAIGGMGVTVGSGMPGVKPAVRWGMVRASDVADFLCEATGTTCLPKLNGSGVFVGSLTDTLANTFDDNAMREPIPVRLPTSVQMIAGPTINVEEVTVTPVLPNASGEPVTWASAGYNVDSFFNDFAGATNQRQLRAAAHRLFKANVTGKSIMPSIPNSYAGVNGAAGASIVTVTRDIWDAYQTECYVDPGSDLLVSPRRHFVGGDTMGIDGTLNAIVATYDGTRATRVVSIGGPGSTVTWNMPWVQARTGLMGTQSDDDVLSQYDAVATAKFRTPTVLHLPDIVPVPAKGEVTAIRYALRIEPVTTYARTTVWTVMTPKTKDSNFWLRQ